MTTTSTRPVETILLVEPDRPHRRALQRWLEGTGRVVWTASSCLEALGVAHREQVDLVVVDLFLGRDSGIDVVRHLKSSCPDLVVVLVSGMLSMTSVLEAFRAGAFDCVEKPFEWLTLLDAIEHGRRLASPARSDSQVLTFRDMKRDFYKRLVEVCGGNITKAAERAGIRRTSLQRILRDAS